MPVYLRITIEGKRTELTTGRECEPSQWIPSAGRMKGTKENVKTFNNYLDTLRAQIDDAHGAMIKAGEVITAQSLKNKFLGKEDKPKMLIEIFEDHNKRYEKLIGNGASKGTLSRYKISLSHTERFLKWRYNLSDFPVRKIDHSFIMDYGIFTA
jgi:hypothetical protein